MKLSDFKALTFDCYGTLIDWETGIWNALQPLLSAGQLQIEREAALNLFARFETEQEIETPSLRYSSLLGVVHARMAKSWGVAAHADLHDRFGGSVPDWPAWPLRTIFINGATTSPYSIMPTGSMGSGPMHHNLPRLFWDAIMRRGGSFVRSVENGLRKPIERFHWDFGCPTGESSPIRRPASPEPCSG